MARIQRIAVKDLTGRMLDAAVAVEVMGWTDLRSQEWEQERIDEWDWPEDIIVTGRNPTLDPEEPGRFREIPPYASDLGAAFQVEERVSDAGPEARAIYGRELGDVLRMEGPWEIGSAEVFRLAHASPAVRCRAALRTVRSLETTQDR